MRNIAPETSVVARSETESGTRGGGRVGRKVGQKERAVVSACAHEERLSACVLEG